MAYWIEQGGAVWLVRRLGKGMLAGMRALPDDGWSAAGDGTGVAALAGEGRVLGSVRHGFTHFDLDLQLMLVSGAALASLTSNEGEWWPIARLDEAGLPTLYARAARLALARAEGD
jgi:A/G-specific adenine glycosylase